jgi:hypothetical protein
MVGNQVLTGGRPMWDTVRITVALVAAQAVVVFCCVAFYFFLDWAARSLAQTGWI